MPPKKKFALKLLSNQPKGKLNYSLSYYSTHRNFKKKNIIGSVVDNEVVKKRLMRKKNKPFNDLGISTKAQFMENATPIIVNAISEVFVANGRSTPSANDIISFSAELHNNLNSSNPIETSLSLSKSVDKEAKLALSKTPLIRNIVQSYGITPSPEDKTRLLSQIVSSFTRKELNDLVFDAMDPNDNEKKMIQVSIIIIINYYYIYYLFISIIDIN